MFEIFNLSIKNSLTHIDKIVESIGFLEYDLNFYFKENIDYLLDDKKMEGLQLFLSKIKS